MASAPWIEGGQAVYLETEDVKSLLILTWSSVSDLQISWEAGSAFTDV